MDFSYATLMKYGDVVEREKKVSKRCLLIAKIMGNATALVSMVTS